MELSCSLSWGFISKGIVGWWRVALLSYCLCKAMSKTFWSLKVWPIGQRKLYLRYFQTIWIFFDSIKDSIIRGAQGWKKIHVSDIWLLLTMIYGFNMAYQGAEWRCMVLCHLQLFVHVFFCSMCIFLWRLFITHIFIYCRSKCRI